MDFLEKQEQTPILYQDNETFNLFLLLSTAGFSQNYQYALDEAPVKTTPETPVVNNQAEETAYFSAYLLPITQKSNYSAGFR